MSRSRFDKFRDDAAVAICNFTLNHIATPWYRVRIERVLKVGTRGYAAEGLAQAANGVFEEITKRMQEIRETRERGDDAA